MSELGYWIEIADPSGVRQAQLDEFLRLSYARTVNDVGVLTLDVPPDMGERIWRWHNRIGVWRQSPGGGLGLETETIWLMQKPERILAENGERRYRITATSASDLLQRRIIAYAAGSAQASKSGYADDVMKAVVRENLEGDAIAARDWSALLTVADDESLGPSISKAFAWRQVLTVLQEIASSAAEQGEPIYFDIVAVGTGLEFRTYYGQRGTDRSQPDMSQLILSPELGQIAQGSYAENHIDEATHIYAAGQGEGEEREVEEAEDVARVNASPFGRIEQLKDARNVTTTTALQDEAKAALYAGRPRRVFQASLVDTPQCHYGTHWHWGDKVLAQFEGMTFTCHIASVTVTVENQAEAITAALQSDEAI